MSKILKDDLSITMFENVYSIVPVDFGFEKFKSVFHILENLILCEKVFVQKKWGL
jgi:hypothetical protein